MSGDWRAPAAEFIGTFALVFVGAGAIMADSLDGGLGHLGVSLAFGLVVAGAVYLFGGVSGAHINPAVTLAFAVTGTFSWRRVPGYLSAQLSGAAAAALLLRFLLGPVAGVGATSTTLSPLAALILEGLLTLFLMAVILAVVESARGGPVSGLAIGGAVFLGALWGGPLTGASMNPARSFGPALAAGDMSQLWMYVAGPVVGALAAVYLFSALRQVAWRPSLGLSLLGESGRRRLGGRAGESAGVVSSLPGGAGESGFVGESRVETSSGGRLAGMSGVSPGQERRDREDRPGASVVAEAGEEGSAEAGYLVGSPW